MKPPALSESAIQTQIRSYLDALSIDAVHVPNGSVLAGDGRARAIQSNALKKAGVLPGFADLILFDRRVRRVGFLEVKAAKGRVSPAQEQFGKLATGVWGLPYAVVRSVEDTQSVLNEWGWRP
jgi:hypothetical protein